MLLGVVAAGVACLGYGVSSVLQAYGARGSAEAARKRGETGHVTASGAPTLRATIAAALSAAFLVGICLDMLGFVGGAVSARLIPLFLSQTIVSANLVVTAVLSTVVLGVRLRTRDWVAIATVVVSLVALGATSGHEGGGSSDGVLHWGLLLGAAVILLGGLALTHWLGSRAAVAAGLIAGVLFGLLAVAVRVLGGLDPLRLGTLLSDPAAYTIVLAGVGGFYLFTVALQLGSVNGATAALVAGETVVPGVLGVALLGDSSRPGWAWLAALGFVGAVLGAVAVAVFGAVEPAEALAAESHTHADD